jgi:putative sterol carrier protein
MSEYATLIPLTGKGGSRNRVPNEHDLDQTFQHMAEALAGSGEEGHFQVRILGSGAELCWNIGLGGKSPEVGRQRMHRPDFEIVTRIETWWHIAEGKLSPLDAFLTGKMRVRGNRDFGQRVFKRLARPEGKHSIC